MRANFQASLAYTLKDEGGNVDDPADRGGRTSRGVTQRTYDAYRKDHGLPLRDVYAMTDVDLETIYLTKFWIPTECDLLPIGPDYAAFDYGVNSSPARAKKAVPKGINAPDKMVEMICASRTSFVNAIKNFARFRKGVLARVARVEVTGVHMALVAMGKDVKFISDVTRAKSQTAKETANKAATKGKTAAVPLVGTTPVGVALSNSSVTSFVIIGVIFVFFALVVTYFAYTQIKHEHRANAYS